MEVLEAGKAAQCRQAITALQQHLNQRVLGQEHLVQRLLIALLADGHLLVEGVPGLAKTRIIKELAASIEASFQRIQFTPDLLPADLTGSEIYRPQEGSFVFQRGPLFHSLILADEVNRAPAKVQSALLEAMAERQITVGGQTYPLPTLFMVMATQNPIEQEGTYALPEAELDRFLMYTRISYPTAETEKQILQLVREEVALANKKRAAQHPKISEALLFAARQASQKVHLSSALEDYLVHLVVATRDPKPYSVELSQWLRFGASPRASISLDRCARAYAWLNDRDYVSPGDIHAIAPDVLRHRILLSYEAQAEGITSDQFIVELLNRVAIP